MTVLNRGKSHRPNRLRYPCLGTYFSKFYMAQKKSTAPYIVEDSVGYLIGRTRAQLAKSIDEALMPHGITYAQGGILLMLMSDRFDSASQLAREMYIDAAAMTRMVDRLVKRSLIRRLPSSKDRRVSRLQLSAGGRRLAEQLPAIYIAARERNFAGLSVEEIGFLKSLLRRVLANAESTLAV